MANKKRGEVAVNASGKSYILRLAVNEICSLEDDLDLGINEIAKRLGDPDKMRMGFVRTVLFHAVDWAAASEPNATKEFAGDLINEVGIETIGEKLGEALQAAFPASEGDEQSPPAKAG